MQGRRSDQEEAEKGLTIRRVESPGRQRRNISAFFQADIQTRCRECPKEDSRNESARQSAILRSRAEVAAIAPNRGLRHRRAVRPIGRCSA